jgi:hypothetical protein
MSNSILDAVSYLERHGTKIPPALMADISIYCVKTYDFFLSTIQKLVKSVYQGNLDNEFITIMYHLIDGQLRDAYQTALDDAGLSPDEVTETMKQQLDGMIAEQQQYVEGYYNDIVSARVDGKPIDSLLSHADIWANQWKATNNAATLEVTKELGGKLEWVLGATEEHCNTGDHDRPGIGCQNLSGMVLFAREWEQAGIAPQTKQTNCGGWRCDCSLVPTNKRRTYGGLNKLMDMMVAANL